MAKSSKMIKPQRSKKHKKLKKFDPVYADSDSPAHFKKRQKNRKEVNSAPKGDDDFMPSSVKKIMRLKKECKTNKFSRPASEDSSGSSSTRQYKQVAFKRRKNESYAQFNNRMNHAVQAAITKSQYEDKFDVCLDEKGKPGEMVIKKEKKEKTEHQKQRLEAKRQRLKERKQNRAEKKMTGFEELRDHVEFGEVAIEPPSLTAKPRKATQNDKPGAKDLLLKRVLTGEKPALPKKREVGKTLKRKHMTLAEKRIMDKEREKAVLMYRQMKEQKLKK